MHLRTAWRGPARRLCPTQPSIYIGRLEVRIFHRTAIFLWKTEEGDHHKERKGRKGEGAWQKDGVRKMRSQEPPSAERGANKHFISRYMGFQNVRSLPQIVRSSLHGRRFNEEISADCTSAATVEGAWQKNGSKKITTDGGGG